MNLISKISLILAVLMAGFADTASCLNINWTRIHNKIYYAKVKVYKSNEIADTVNIVKILPDAYIFRLLNEDDATIKPIIKNIEDWQESSGALVLCNSSYYDEKFKPATAAIVNGRANNLKKLKKGALFVASPAKDSHLPEANIIDLETTPSDLKNLPYLTAIQSYPVLLDKYGRIHVKRSEWRANRTVIAKDRSGNILIFVTEGTEKYYSFTLYEMAEWLKNSGLNIEIAMNMDGGYESELCIRTSRFSYATYGQWEFNDSGDKSKPGLKMWLPFVIAVFPKSY